MSGAMKPEHPSSSQLTQGATQNSQVHRPLDDSQTQATSLADTQSQAAYVARRRFMHIGESQASTPRAKRRVDLLAGERSSPTSGSPKLPPKIHRNGSALRVLSPSVRIHVLRDGRLTDAEVERLSKLAESLDALVFPTQHLCNLVLCSLRSAKRVSKYLDDEVIKNQVPILHYEWLEECAEKRLMQPFRKYWIAPEGSPSATLDMGHTKLMPKEEEKGEAGWDSTEESLTQRETQTQTRAEVKREAAFDESETWITQMEEATLRSGMADVLPTPRAPAAALPPAKSGQQGRQDGKVDDDETDDEEEIVLLPTQTSKTTLGKRARSDSLTQPSLADNDAGPSCKMARESYGPPSRFEAEEEVEETYEDDNDDAESYGSREGEDWEDGEGILGGPAAGGSTATATMAARSTSPRQPVPRYRNEAYACLRPSPLTCVNQDLVDELEVVRLSRSFGGPANVQQAASYSRALSAIKAFPEPLSQQPAMAKRLKGIGKKIAGVIEQYYAVGYIAEATAIRSDRSFRAMCEFTELYGIGPFRARDLYQQGCRTLEDVVRTGTSIANSIPMDECLRILPDLRTKIPRREVEYIAELIQSEMDAVCPGAVHTICGGYRRGKAESNDVDIVMTIPGLETRTTKGHEEQWRVLRGVLDAMKRRGLMTHAVKIGPDRNELPTSRIDVASIVFLPLVKPGVVSRPTHRRVDLIFCSYKVYGAAILGWTGSRQFEKDIRRHAKDMGFRFHSSGLVPLRNNERGEAMDTPREEDVFRLLELEYMPPEWRNCDA